MGLLADTLAVAGHNAGHPLGVIALEEVSPPPPPPPRATVSCASSVPSSSAYSSESESESDSSDDEDECSSYCSSDEGDMLARNHTFCDDTYGTRLNRVLVWRENFAKAMGLPADDHAQHLLHAPHPVKRKFEYEDVFDDTASSSSKRSRCTSPEPSLQPRPQFTSQRRLSAHSCPACDEGFNTKQGLQQHGRNDACRVAVMYGLEAASSPDLPLASH